MLRIEYGSDFHLPLNDQWYLSKPENSFFNFGNFKFFASGRAALYAILRYEQATNGIDTLYLPSYYCHEVDEFIAKLSIDIHYYPCNPLQDAQKALEQIPNDRSVAVVTTSYFGIPAGEVGESDTLWIEDLTHSLAAIKESNATYVFGSLRKELPMPLGGFAYSTVKELPVTASNSVIENLWEGKAKAMKLKGKYLKGEDIDKAHFRALFASLEVALSKQDSDGGLTREGIDFLRKLDCEAIFQQKQKNINHLKTAINRELLQQHGIQLVGNASFALTLKFQQQKERDQFKKHLIDRNLFPAILWPAQKQEPDKQLEDRLLMLHVDFRYESKDIEAMASIINEYSG